MKRLVIDYDKTYESNNYGEFKILSEAGRASDGALLVKIQFINTGYETTVRLAAAKRGSVRDHTLPFIKKAPENYYGKVYKSNNYGEFMILGDAPSNNTKIHNVRIRFINTGCENIVMLSDALNGCVRDSSVPYNCICSIDIDYDKIYHSRIYGDFKIISKAGYKGDTLLVKIQFIDTGYEDIVTYQRVKLGSVKDKSPNAYKRKRKKWSIDFDKIYQSNNYGPFIITSRAENYKGEVRVNIKFLNTGYEKVVLYKRAIDGMVKDNSVHM